MQKNKPYFFTANWAAPKTVKTIITTRGNGYSKEPYSSFNLAAHVKDNDDAVIKNRELLNRYLPDTPFWLNQTHSDQVVDIDNASPDNFDNNADATITTMQNKVCAVLTADCLPILLTDINASFVAAVHAGWRGVLNEIIANTVSKISGPHHNVLAFIGPAICEKHFEVGQEVFELFLKLDQLNVKYFSRGRLQKIYNCNLQEIAKQQLINLGLKEENISISQNCTVCDNHLFYSYRREEVTGRFANLIWLDQSS